MLDCVSEDFTLDTFVSVIPGTQEKNIKNNKNEKL